MHLLYASLVPSELSCHLSWEGAASAWLGGLLDTPLQGPLQWKRNLCTALPATWDACLNSSKWSGAKSGRGWSSEGNPEQMPKDTSLGNGKATTQTQLSAFEVNTFSLISGP